MTRPVTRPFVIISTKMKQSTDREQVQPQEPQSFIVRMWQETPGAWRGTVRHVQSQAQLGFMQIDQASRFIGNHTIGVEKKHPVQTPARRPLWNVDLGFSRRTTRMLAIAAAIVLIAAVGLIAAGQGNLTQVLGFGH